MKSVKPPKVLKDFFTLAITYLKPKLITGPGRVGSTFTTTVNTIERKTEDGKERDGQERILKVRVKTTKVIVTDRTKPNDQQERNQNASVAVGIIISTTVQNFWNLKKMKEEEKQAAMTWDAMMFVTYQVNAISALGFKLTKVLLDNQANISIMRPELSMAFEKTENGIRVNDVGGVQLYTDKTGYLEDFFRVYRSTESKKNILSFADVEDMYTISYVADLGIPVVAVTRAYTKAEEVTAKQAYEVIHNAGYPSYVEAVHMIQDGNFSIMPMLIAEDAKRACEYMENLLVAYAVK